MMLGGSSPRSCVPPSQTLGRMVARMEAPPGTWLHACGGDECWLEEGSLSVSCMRRVSQPESKHQAMVDVPST